MFFACFVCGILFATLIIDGFGLLNNVKRSIGMARIAGILLTLSGCIMLAFSKKDGSDMKVSVIIVVAITSILTGTCAPLQAACNRQLKLAKNLTTGEAALFSFCSASVIMTIVYALSTIIIPLQIDSGNNQWWHWFGGVLGVIYVSSGVVIPSIIGYSSFFVCTLAGQLLLSLLSEVFGLLGPALESAKTVLSICGVMITLIGAAVVSMSETVDSACGQHSLVSSQEQVQQQEEGRCGLYSGPVHTDDAPKDGCANESSFAVEMVGI